jgi:NTE family protein
MSIRYALSTIHALSLVTIVLITQPLAHGQESAVGASSVSRRGEKIGLVLAGGGALGMAHVGVLKVLEEQHIPVAYVAGTSMGSIVGAAYATGQTVPEMEKVLKESDWDEIFSDGVAREELPYRTKSGYNREIYGDTKISLEGGKLVTPFGVVQGQRLLPVLQRLYSNAPASPSDFNTFRIPLRVVAADIETGEAVVVSKGDLPTAVRASMSVPGVFAPVEMDGRLLVDGGVVNNLPMDVVRKMGATRLIVVELNADLKKKDELQNPLATAGQIISLLLAQNSALQKKTLTKKDILIEPDLTGFSAVDFAKATELIQLGEEAARRMLPELKKLSVSEREYAQFKNAREVVSADPTVEFITVSTDKRGADKNIEKVVEAAQGKPLDRNFLDQKIEEIYNTGEYVSVRYDVVEQDGKTGVQVTANRKKWLDDYFRFGASLQDDFQGETNYSMGGAYRVNELTSQGGWAQGEVVIGFSPKLSAEFYQPLGEGSPYFVSPRLAYNRQTIYPMSDGEIVAQYMRESAMAGFGIGREIGHSGEIMAEYRAADANISRHIGDPDLPDQNFQIGEVAATLNIDSADNPDFPTEGVLTRASFIESSNALGSSDNFEQFSGMVAKPFTYGRSTLLLGGDFGRSLGNLPVYRSNAFGGFMNFSGYTQNSILAADWGIARANYYRRFSEMGSSLLGLGFFVGGTVEYGTFTNSSEQIESMTGVFAGSGFLGVDTPLVPIYVGLGAAEQGERSAYFAVGRLSGR